MLGVSLPWVDMLTDSRRGPDFVELLHETLSSIPGNVGSKEFANSSNSFLPQNGIVGSERASSTKSSSSVLQGSSGNFVDFLTGDFDMLNQSDATENTSFVNVEQTNSFDDDFDVNPFATASETPSVKVNSQVEEFDSAHIYLKFFESFSGNIKVFYVQFISILFISSPLYFIISLMYFLIESMLSLS